MSNKTKGILLIITAAFAFALMNSLVKLSGDLPSIQKSFFRNAITFFFALGVLIKNGKRPQFQRKNVPWLLLRSACGTLGVLCNFYAVDRLILADSSLLAKLAPFFAVLVSCFILKEKPRVMQVLFVLGAFLGSYFLLNPTLTSFSFSLPSAVAVLGALCGGIAYTVVRKLGMLGQDSATIILFFTSFSCLTIFPFFVLNFQPMTPVQLLFLLLAGLAATLGQFAVTNAYIYAAAREISVFDYSQVMFAAIFGFFLYGEVPSLASLPGYVLICSMGILAFFYARHQSTKD